MNEKKLLSSFQKRQRDIACLFIFFLCSIWAGCSRNSPFEGLLPGPNELPQGLKGPDYQFTSNKDIAKVRPNPADVYAMLESFGRTVGLSEWYYTDCYSQNRFTQIQFDLVLMESASGASKYQEWLRKEDKDAKSLEGVGENAYAAWRTDEDGCKMKTRLVEVTFRRDKIIGVVTVGSHERTGQDGELLAQAKYLAGIIDLNIFERVND